MNNPTMADAEEAARLLGIDVYMLGLQLRWAAADAFEGCASEVRKDGRPDSYGRARRLLAAAEACEKAWDEVQEAATA